MITDKSLILLRTREHNLDEQKTTSVNLSPSTHLSRITPGKLFLLWTPRQQLKTHLLIQ